MNDKVINDFESWYKSDKLCICAAKFVNFKIPCLCNPLMTLNYFKSNQESSFEYRTQSSTIIENDAFKLTFENIRTDDINQGINNILKIFNKDLKALHKIAKYIQGTFFDPAHSNPFHGLFLQDFYYGMNVLNLYDLGNFLKGDSDAKLSKLIEGFKNCLIFDEENIKNNFYSEDLFNTLSDSKMDLRQGFSGHSINLHYENQVTDTERKLISNDLLFDKKGNLKYSDYSKINDGIILRNNFFIIDYFIFHQENYLFELYSEFITFMFGLFNLDLANKYTISGVNSNIDPKIYGFSSRHWVEYMGFRDLSPTLYEKYLK